MIHFAYPNVIPRDSEFIGCGRFASFLPGNIPKKEYKKAILETPNRKAVMRAAALLASDSFKSEKIIYELKDEPDRTYRGDSMDLAYLLSYISCSRKLRLQRSKKRTDIWCTGCVSIAGATPLLDDVDNTGFDLKMKGFLSEKNSDTLFILPAGNFKDLSPEKHKEIRENKVRCLSVDEFKHLPARDIFEQKTILKVLPDELPELADALFAKPPEKVDVPETKTGTLKKLFACFALLMLIASAWGLYWFSEKLPVESVIVECLENGEFFKADKLIKKSSPKNMEVQRLRQQINTPVKIDVKFQFQKAGHPPSKLYPVESDMLKRIILTHKDNYRLQISNASQSESLYLYVFQKDHLDNIDRLFPKPEWHNNNNPLRYREFPCRIPPDKGNWMYLDEIAFQENGYVSEETIYIIASPWKAEDMENLYGEIYKETVQKDRYKQLGRFLRQLRLREDSGFQSVFYKKISFKHGQ